MDEFYQLALSKPFINAARKPPMLDEHCQVDLPPKATNTKQTMTERTSIPRTEGDKVMDDIVNEFKSLVQTKDKDHLLEKLRMIAEGFEGQNLVSHSSKVVSTTKPVAVKDSHCQLKQKDSHSLPKKATQLVKRAPGQHDINS